MIVWGGTNRRTDLADGAAYNPSTRTWRKIAAAPRGVRGVVDTAAVWTGKAALFWAGNSPEGPAGGALYDPRANRWQRIPAGPLGPREGYSTYWTGTEALIVGGTRGDGFATPVAAAFKPATRRWRRLPALDRLTGLLAGGVWAGDRAYLVGDQYTCPELDSGCRDKKRRFLTYEPTADRVRFLDPSKAPGRWPTAWTGSTVFFAPGRDGGSPASYSPAGGGLTVGAREPCAPSENGYEQSAWIGDRYVAPCGRKGLQVYDPRTDAWRRLTPGRSPLNSRSGSAIVWTGRELIAWSGMLRRAGNPMSRAGMTLTLPR
jgi:hypothetical protein